MGAGVGWRRRVLREGAFFSKSHDGRNNANNNKKKHINSTTNKKSKCSNNRDSPYMTSSQLSLLRTQPR